MSHDPFKNFEAEFADTKSKIEKAHRAMVPVAIAGVLFSVGLVGFICWAIYRLVTHFTGAH